MSYSVENVNSCTKKLVFKFDSLDLSSEITKALSKKQKDVNLKGFRKGKAPLAMVEKLYRPEVEADALNSFVTSQFFSAVQEEKLNVVGRPSFENMNYQDKNSVSFDAIVEVFPEVEVKTDLGKSFKKESSEVTSEDIENAKKGLLDSKSEIVALEDASTPLTDGLYAIFNFQGEKENGERPENMKGEEFQLEIGSGQFIPGFEEGMQGMKAGEEKVLELSFPADYHMEDLRDAKVKFEVKLLEIKEKKLPELNDELVKEMGYDSVADFNEKTESSISERKKAQAQEKLNQEMLDALVEKNQFDVPLSMVAQQESYVKNDMKSNLQRQGMTDEMVEEYFVKWKDDLVAKAEFQVRSGLVLDSLAKKYGVEITDEDLNEKLEGIAKSGNMEVEKLKEYYLTSEQAKTNFTYALREEKTFDKLAEELGVK